MLRVCGCRPSKQPAKHLPNTCPPTHGHTLQVQQEATAAGPPRGQLVALLERALGARHGSAARQQALAALSDALGLGPEERAALASALHERGSKGAGAAAAAQAGYGYGAAADITPPREAGGGGGRRRGVLGRVVGALFGGGGSSAAPGGWMFK
jgi:hypothetical protein